GRPTSPRAPLLGTPPECRLRFRDPVRCRAPVCETASGDPAVTPVTTGPRADAPTRHHIPPRTKCVKLSPEKPGWATSAEVVKGRKWLRRFAHDPSRVHHAAQAGVVRAVQATPRHDPRQVAGPGE